MEPHIPASVAKDRVLTFNLCLHQWHRNDQLAGYLKHPERSAEALRALAESQQADLDNEALSQWCAAWLTEDGWKRLQDDVARYHRRPKVGAKYQSVILERETVNELYGYAAQQGLTINEAVQTLIQIAGDAGPGRGSQGPQ